MKILATQLLFVTKQNRKSNREREKCSVTKKKSFRFLSKFNATFDGCDNKVDKRRYVHW